MKNWFVLRSEEAVDGTRKTGVAGTVDTRNGANHLVRVVAAELGLEAKYDKPQNDGGRLYQGMNEQGVNMDVMAVRATEIRKIIFLEGVVEE